MLPQDDACGVIRGLGGHALCEFVGDGSEHIDLRDPYFDFACRGLGKNRRDSTQQDNDLSDLPATSLRSSVGHDWGELKGGGRNVTAHACKVNGTEEKQQPDSKQSQEPSRPLNHREESPPDRSRSGGPRPG